MSSFMHFPMRLNHDVGLFSHALQVLRLWRRRSRERREMAEWSLRDMNDAGVSWCDAVTEMNKPFWRA